MLKRLSKMLDVPVNDPDDARKRKLLNILLFGGGVLALMVLVTTAIMGLLGPGTAMDDALTVYASGIAFLLGIVVIYLINRHVSGSLAGMIFVIMWMVMLPFIDLPGEVANGRSLFVFTIPIVLSSVLLRPYSAFIFAALSNLIISVMAASIGEIPNIPAILGFFMIALVSWLSARSLENVLKELILINRDLDQRVVERTQALSEALSRERAEAGRNQAILDDIADGVIVLDNDDRAIVSNPAVEPFLGRASSLVMGMSLEELLAQSDIGQREHDNLVAFFRDPASCDGNIRVQWGRKTLAISVAPVHATGGGIIGKVAVFHDFTREAEVDRMKSDFVAMVSHELRTPLNSIMGYADMLHEGVYGKMDGRQMGIVERMMANTHKLLSIVNDLLDQAQIEAGRLTFRNRHFRVTELVDYVRGVMENLMQSKGLQLVITTSDDLPYMLFGDPQRLNQVLINLVNNAVKFTEHGSIHVQFYRSGPYHWAIDVTDTGVGIPVEAQKYIFEPFRQADMEITRRPGGIGLGLSIVKRLVNLMEGEITLKSQVGQGSTFTVTLPLNIVEKETVINE